MKGWCLEFDIDDKKEVGNIIREVLEILKNKQSQLPLYNYDNQRYLDNFGGLNE